jgi:hypothetical protein
MTPRDRLLAQYGLTTAQYAKMLKRQGGKCALCGRRPKTRRLAIDHDHTCTRKPSKLHGRVRGLVDQRCNRFLIASNTVQTARRLVEYLSSDFNGRNL